MEDRADSLVAGAVSRLKGIDVVPLPEGSIERGIVESDDPAALQGLDTVPEFGESIGFPCPLGLVAAGRASCALGGCDAIDESVPDLGELHGGAALSETGLPVLAEKEVWATSLLAGDVDEVADADLAAEGQVRGKCLGNLMGDDPACFVGVSWGGVIGGPAGAHEAAERGGIVAGEGLEMGDERTEISVIAGGYSGAADGIHALVVTPGIEGFAGVHQASFLLTIEGFARGHDERLDLGWRHVSSAGFCGP
jgi:hypothetical protein